MAHARYTIVAPKHPDKDLAGAAHHWMHYGDGPSLIDSHIHRDVEGPRGMVDHIIALGEDTPELDSHMKQLAHHLAEVAGASHTYVHKEGKSGIQSWPIRNLNASVPHK